MRVFGPRRCREESRDRRSRKTATRSATATRYDGHSAVELRGIDAGLEKSRLSQQKSLCSNQRQMTAASGAWSDKRFHGSSGRIKGEWALALRT